MKTKLLTLFVALFATSALWAQNNVITYTATEKLASLFVASNFGGVAISSHEFAEGQGTVTFTGDVTTIGEFAFSDCSGLTSITIPNSVTTIGAGAFWGCSGLTSVTIPNSVTTIGDYAFILCSNLTSVTIGNSVTTIGSYAFSDCSGLTSITIPNSVTTIGGYAFQSCRGLTSINVDAGNANYCSIDGVLFNYIKDTLIQYPISNTRTAYTIPCSVTTIGKYAFYACSGLTSITIPSSVTTIGYYAFAYCSGLTSINVDAGNAHYCSIDGVLFNYIKDTLIQYPIGNTRTAYTIPNSVITVGERAFVGCSGLTSITIPNSVTTIGVEAFEACRGLTSVTIGNSVTTIGKEAFFDCDALTSITIPSSVTTIGGYAFEGCIGLTSINVDAGNAHYCSIDGVLFNYIKDTLIQYPIGNTRTAYTIPNSVIRIGGYAFRGCRGLTSITIPNSVTTIEDAAFAYCSGLTSITCEATTPPTCGYYCFYNVDHSIPLYVPVGSVTAYQTANEWKDFTNIIPVGETTGLNSLPYEGKDGLGAVKMIMNGQLYILRDNKLYNAAGAEVK